MSGRCVVHVAEIIPGPGLPDPLRVPREPVPAAAGGAVGHLDNKNAFRDQLCNRRTLTIDNPQETFHLSSASHGHTEGVTLLDTGSLQAPLGVTLHVVDLVVNSPHLYVTSLSI